MLATAFLSLALPAPLQDIVPLLMKGDSFPPMGNVVDVEGVGMDPSGAWMASIRTDVANTDRDTGIVSSTAGVVLREHDLVPAVPGARLDLFFGEAMADDHGLLAKVRLRNTDPAGDQVVLWDGDVVAREGDLVAATGIPPAATWVWFVEVGLGGETAYVLGEYDDGVDQPRALVAIDAGGSSQAIAVEGHVLVGTGETIENLFNLSVSEGGQSAIGVLLSGPSQQNNALIIDGQLVLRGGDPSPIPGWTWHAYMPAGHAALNRHGDYACGAMIIQNSNARDVLVHNGEIVLQADEVLPDIAPHKLLDVTVPAQGLSDDGDILWHGRWQVANGSYRSGLFLNRRLLVHSDEFLEGKEIYNFTSFGLTSNGRYVWFGANLNGGGRGLFQIDRKIGESYCGPAVANSTGVPGELHALGDTLASWGELRHDAHQLPPGEFGYFLASKTEAFVPMPGGAQGNLCLGGLIGRFTDQIGQVTAGGDLTAQVNLLDIPPNQGAVMPGDTWHFQAWYRDANPIPTSNFTDGVRVTFL